MNPVFEHRFTVNEKPEDYIRHVDNVRYLSWFIDTAIEHSDAMGGGREICKGLGLAWVVKTHTIEYIREAFQGDQLIIYTWIHKIDRSRSIRRYKCVREDNAKVIAKAETLWVLVDYKTGRPKALPEDLRKKFTVVQEKDEP